MAKGMDAVLEKTNAARKKRPLLRKKGAGKGPGMAIMIAVGAPKKGPMGRPMGGMEAEDDAEAPMAEIARLKAKIAQLKARLAEYEGEDEGEEEEYEGEDEEMED